MLKEDYFKESYRALFLDTVEEYTRLASELEQYAKLEGSSHVFNNLGLVYLELGERDAAMKSLSKAIELDASNNNALHNRAQQYVQEGKLDLAEADFNDSVAAAPKEVTHRRARGYFFKEQRRYQEAIADFEKADELQPGFPGCGAEVAQIKEIMKAPIKSYLKKLIQDKLS